MLNAVKHLARVVERAPNDASEMLHYVQHDVLLCAGITQKARLGYQTGF